MKEPSPAPTAKAVGLLEGIAADLRATIGTLGNDGERAALTVRVDEVTALLKGDV